MDASTEEGLRLLKAGQTNEAIEVLGKVLEADGDDAKAHMYIGIAYNQKNDKLHAIHHLEESLRLEETPKGYYNLALVYEAAHRVDEAIRQYKMALELDPNYTLAQQALQKLHDQFAASHAPPAPETPEASATGQPAQAPQQPKAAAPAGATAVKAPGPIPGPVPGPASGPPQGTAGAPLAQPVGGPPAGAWMARQIAEQKKIRDAQRELTRSGIIYGAICGAFLFMLLNLVGTYAFAMLGSAGMGLVMLLIEVGKGTLFGAGVGFWIGCTAGDESQGIIAGAVIAFVITLVAGLISGVGEMGIGFLVLVSLMRAVVGAAGGWIIGKLVTSSIGGV